MATQMQRYPLCMVNNAARVVLDAGGSCMQYTPETSELEVVLHTRGEVLTDLYKVVVCTNKRNDRWGHVTFDAERYEGDMLHGFFETACWERLIAGELVCDMIKGTSTTCDGGCVLGRYHVYIQAPLPDQWVRFEFKRAKTEVTLPYGRMVAREQEYVHEYRNSLRHGASAVHQAKLDELEALPERQKAALMAMHKRLGAASTMGQLDHEMMSMILRYTNPEGLS